MWVRGGVGGWAVSQPHLPGALQSLSWTLEMETLHVLAVYLRWLDTVFQGQYLPSLSINYVAINKVLEKLPPQLY